VARLRLSVIPEFRITASVRNPHGPERRTRRWLLACGRLSAGALGAGFIVFGVSVLASAQTLSWSVVPSPNRVTESFLGDVSCASATACMALGDNYISNGAGSGVYKNLAESWNGTSWSLVNVPSPGSFSSLNGVSCVSPAVCTAVGYVSTLSGGYRTLIESWNGTSWSVVPSPSIGSPSDQNYLSGVSCTSVTACTAVGYHYNGVFKTLIESWNGTSWSVVPSPNPEPSTNDSLYSVSCISATACTAVGSRLSSSYRTLIESWDGTSWSVVASPNVGSATSPNVLGAVSCTSATACTAVGTHYASSSSSGRTLVESWNGASWSVVPSPSPGPSATGDALVGVSCTSATVCTAIGYGGTGGVYQTLIESWNGTSWAVVPSPNVGTISSDLNGVSCTSATVCTAVGTYYVHGSSGDLGRTLIESGTASG
jgi:hypothetical protein